MKPSIVGQKQGGAEVQKVATGSSLFCFASTASFKTRLIPAATQALREIGHEDESTGIMGAGEKDTGQMWCFHLSCSCVRAPDDGTDQDLGVRDERRGEKAVMRLERESAECSSRGQSAILHISTYIC